LPRGHVPLVACSQHDLRVAPLQAEQFVLPGPGAFPRLHGAGRAPGRQVAAVAVAESHFPGAELQHVAGVLVRARGQAAVVAEEAVVRGLEVVALVPVDQRHESVHPPGDVAVYRHLVRLRARAQVRVALARQAVQVDLRVHGQVHAPPLRRRGRLREAGDAVLAAAEVPRVRLRLQRPAPVLVRGDHEAAVAAAARLAVRGDVAVFVRGEVAAQVGAQEHGAAVLPGLLQGPGLLLLQAAGRRVDFEAEGLRRQILALAVDEPQRDLQQVPGGAVCGHVCRVERKRERERRRDVRL